MDDYDNDNDHDDDVPSTTSNPSQFNNTNSKITIDDTTNTAMSNISDVNKHGNGNMTQSLGHLSSEDQQVDEMDEDILVDDNDDDDDDDEISGARVDTWTNATIQPQDVSSTNNDIDNGNNDDNDDNGIYELTDDKSVTSPSSSSSTPVITTADAATATATTSSDINNSNSSATTTTVVDRSNPNPNTPIVSSTSCSPWKKNIESSSTPTTTTNNNEKNSFTSLSLVEIMQEQQKEQREKQQQKQDQISQQSEQQQYYDESQYLQKYHLEQEEIMLQRAIEQSKKEAELEQSFMLVNAGVGVFADIPKTSIVDSSVSTGNTAATATTTAFASAARPPLHTSSSYFSSSSISKNNHDDDDKDKKKSSFMIGKKKNDEEEIDDDDEDDEYEEDRKPSAIIPSSNDSDTTTGTDCTPITEITKNDNDLFEEEIKRAIELSLKNSTSTSTTSVTSNTMIPTATMKNIPSSIKKEVIVKVEEGEDKKPSAVVASSKVSDTATTSSSSSTPNTKVDVTTTTTNSDSDYNFEEEMKRVMELSLKDVQHDGVPDSVSGNNNSMDEQLTSHHFHGDDSPATRTVSTKDLGLECGEMNYNEDGLDASTTTTSTFHKSSSQQQQQQQHLSQEEMDNITKALREADENQELASIRLAMQLQQEEEQQQLSSSYSKMQHQQQRLEEGKHSGLQTVQDDVFQEMLQQRKDMKLAGSGKTTYHQYETYDNYFEEDEDEQNLEEEEGYRINSSSSTKSKQQWKTAKVGMGFIQGPNNEIRTKHDVQLKNESNAERLLLDGKQQQQHNNIAKNDYHRQDNSTNDYSMTKSNSSISFPKNTHQSYSSPPPPHSSSSSTSTTKKKLAVSDVAYNSYHQSMKKINSSHRSTVKGIAAHGARTEKSFEKTRGGAMDNNTRLIISKAINNGIIQSCNGVVKEGKEAIVYHADGVVQGGGSSISSNGGLDVEMKVSEEKFDVAIKVRF